MWNYFDIFFVKLFDLAIVLRDLNSDLFIVYSTLLKNMLRPVQTCSDGLNSFENTSQTKN